MEKMLYDACLEGDFETLEALMKEDKLTLARVSLSSCFTQTPLHVACMLGHFEFAKSLLCFKPNLASNLDLQGRSALHLASANGYANIVELLLEYDQMMCRLPDEDGRTPLHLAVLKGQHECVIELLKVKSESDQEGTILQLCVTYNRLNVLIHILESSDRNLSNIKYDDGNTILHSATALRRMQIIKYLVKCRSEVDVNGVNEKGLTALDIIEEMPNKDMKSKEIREFLISAGTLRAKEIKASTSLLIPGVDEVADDNMMRPAATGSFSKLVRMWKEVKNSSIFQEEVEKKDETVLVAASVIAAMAYASASSPPGGVVGMDAQAHPDDNIDNWDLEPGASLLAYFWPGMNNAFWISNTIAFLSALTVIFVHVSGATLKKKIFVRLMRGGMWVTLSAMTTAYACAVLASSPDSINYYLLNNSTIFALVIGLCAWVAMVGVATIFASYSFLRYTVTTFKKKAAKNNHTAGPTPNQIMILSSNN